MIEGLKPCPFCGGKAAARKVNGGLGTYSRLAKCGCEACNIFAVEVFTADWDFHGQEQAAERKSVERWNTRTEVRND